MIGAGSLDRRITIERYVETRDPVYNSVSYDWTSWQPDVPANVRTAGGREFLEAGGQYVERRAIFKVRWIPDLQTTDRVSWNGRAYDIKDVREIGRRRFLEIHAEAVT